MQKIYPVIHAESPSQVFRNIQLCIDTGADGTFIINHGGITPVEMLGTIDNARYRFPEFFIGINLLDFNDKETFKIAHGMDVNAVWIDDSHITHDNSQSEELAQMDKYRKIFQGQYFGSVAFKTQGKCPNPAAAARNAIGHVDVVTTSGPRTAHPPDVAKIRDMKEAIGNIPLAIASGITPDNIHLYPMANIIMVASGISKSWTEIDPEKLKLLIERKFRGE